jgi:adenylate cyclase
MKNAFGTLKVRTRELISTVGVGIGVGALCAALMAFPTARELEQQFGLRWLFNLRGPIEPPDVVAVVVVNQLASSQISLPRDPDLFHRCAEPVIGRTPTTYIRLPAMPSRWPRCLHAQLVEKLMDAGAAVIAFDMLFRARPPLPGASGDLNAWQDEVLAAAIAASGRVVLAQKLENLSGQQTLSEVSPSIAHAALGVAPFPLVVRSSRVDRFPTFEQSQITTPTLPTIAVQAFALDVYPRLLDLLARHAGDRADLLPRVGERNRGGQLAAIALLTRQLFRDNEALAGQMREELKSSVWSARDTDARARIGALVSLYSGHDVRLLNFYGPSGTIPSVTYDRVLAESAQDLSSRFRGRAVFVGYSEGEQPEQTEHFATAFSSDQKPDLSGVEIAATGFANLLQDTTLRDSPLAVWLLLTFLTGVFATVACLRLRNRVAFVLVATFAAVYCGAALLAFAVYAIWIPFVVPLFVTLPAATLSSFGWKFWTTRRQREQLRRAFSYFVPRDVVEMLEQNAADVGRVKESLECACVWTDAANYTPLAEAMTPEQLTEFLNLYFEALFAGVASHGGFVSDVAGDAMLAIWPHRSPDTHRRLLTGLLEMRDAAHQFNERIAGSRLGTRFGVDWGPVTLATVGARSHYEYRAVGEVVNTSERIQELNKRLGTRVLISHASIGDAGSEFLTRDVGHFLLRGKHHAVHIHELIAARADATQQQHDLCGLFTECMKFLVDADRERALSQLLRMQTSFPSDGPTAFYLRTLDSGIAWEDGALKLD